MIKDLLKSKEPVVYQSLYNDLVNDRLSHCYLFVGEYNPFKLDVAYLLAQSIIEGKNDFACETCTTCKRIKEGNYIDFKYIDGYDESIKKDDIEKLMTSMYSTALEKAGKKVYIISNINNSSIKVLNMILKFIEDPVNNTYAIFICDDENTLLQTIVSRCQKIRFKTRDFSFLIDDYKKNGFAEDDAYLLSSIKHIFDKELLEDNTAFNKGKDLAYDLIDNLDETNYIPVLISKEFVASLPKKEYLKESIDYFIDIMLLMLQDAISNNSIEDDNYNLKLGILSKHNIELLLSIFVEARNMTFMQANRQLLLDRIAYEIIK